jgi:DNA (cytosine-5)-methyltransferase 1
MKYLSVCSGIEAATVAWHPLGWQPLAFSEIEPFPRKVLEHHYPDVPCYGDFTKLREMDFIKDADLLVGGTPCQAFSVAGLRQSLDDDRGNLTLEFVRLADAIDDLRPNRPCTIVWENVPGVLSVQDNAFGCFLAALVGNDAPLVPTGGKWTNAGLVVGPKRSAAWRVFDAQYFGVAQRRRRVFVVAGAGDGFDPAEVLFEREGMRRDTAPSRSKGENPSNTITSRTGISRNNHEEVVIAKTLQARIGNAGFDLDTETPVIAERRTGSGKDIFPSLMANVGTKLWLGNQEALSGDYHILEPICASDGQPNASFNTNVAPALNSTHEQPYVVHGTQDPCVSDIAFAQGRNNGAENVLVQPIAIDYEYNAHGIDEPTGPLLKGSPSGGGHPLPAVMQPIGFYANQGAHGNGDTYGISVTLKAHPKTSNLAAIATSMAVRRLTPKECERLQGFPDDYTNIPKAADGPRYKALGNSMAVPVMAWIGKRIDEYVKAVSTEGP